MRRVRGPRALSRARPVGRIMGREKTGSLTRASASFPWMWAVLLGFLWEVLLRAQNPGLMADDSGEMAASAFNLGLPHPPGYPFFDLLGHWVSWLPVGTVAFRFNLFSSLIVLLSVVFAVDICRRIRTLEKKGSFSGELLLLVMGWAFVSARNVFAQCLTAKGCIYTLSLCSTAAALWLYTLWNEDRSRTKPLIGAFFLWGLGLANHWQTHLLWIPFLTVWALQARRLLTTRSILRVLSFVVLGLSLYLYLPFRAERNCQPCWGYPIDWRLFYWVVSRQLVAGVEPLVQNPAFYLKSAKEMMNVGFNYWPPGFAVLCLLGIFRMWMRNYAGLYGFLAMFLSVLSGVLAVHEEQNIYLVPVYLVALSGPALLFGFTGAEWLRQRMPSKALALSWVLFLGLASGLWMAKVFGLEDKSRYTIAEDFGTNALQELDRGAIFLADGDDYVMPVWYGLYVRHQRPDVTFEPTVFLYHGWGWKQISDQSADLTAAGSYNIFQDKLESLTRLYPIHPLYYALGPGYLIGSFQKLPGSWELKGLVLKWEPGRLPPAGMAYESRQVIFAGRLRGLENRNLHDLDPASAQICRYYTDLSLIPALK